MTRRDPIAELTSLISQYAAEDFIAQRKRLREARMRWIEEHECPKPYQVTTADKDGKETTFSTPFEVGSLKYPDQYNEKWKEEGQRHEDPETEKKLLEGIEAVLSQSSPDKQLTILISESNEQKAFFTGGDEQSPHPPILEGESYAEYFARVACEYEQAAGQNSSTATGRPVSGDDGVRESPPADPARVGSDDAPGDGPHRDAGPVLGGDTHALRPGDQDGDPPGAGSSDTVPASTAAAAPG